MLSDTPRRFDLYDFFSVLLPGVALLLGLVPFLPKDTDLGALGAVLPLLIGGFVFGRAIHTVGVRLEDAYEEAPTHRERFIQEVNDPEVMTEETVRCFYQECINAFDIVDDDDQWQRNGQDEDLLEDIYGLVRSYIHIDSRGRSRTFQAVYSFYRGMWVVSLIVAVVYLLYGLLKGINATEGLVTFTSFFGTLGMAPGLIVLGSVIVALLSHEAFSQARGDYQEHFVRYLVADFLILQGVDYPEAIVTTTTDSSVPDDDSPSDD